MLWAAACQESIASAKLIELRRHLDGEPVWITKKPPIVPERQRLINEATENCFAALDVYRKRKAIDLFAEMSLKLAR